MDPFSQVAIKVKKWLILEVHEMIGVLHLVACPMVFNLLCGRVHQGGMLKLVKNDYFLVFLTIPPSFWVAYGVVYIRMHEMIKVSHSAESAPNSFFSTEIGRKQCSKL